jgi:hypothetical protein
MLEDADLIAHCWLNYLPKRKIARSHVNNVITNSEDVYAKRMIDG